MRSFDSLDHLGLDVSDVKRSFEFYRDFLGLRAGSFDDEIGEVWAGTAIIVLLKDTPSPDGIHFGFREDSRAAVDEWGQKAVAAGVAIDFGPAQQDWGGYEVTILDPDGYAIQIWTDAGQ